MHPLEKLTSAIDFAATWHKDQRRKYTNEPYINHPIEVMQIVSEVVTDIDTLCAAVLHDVVEDCGVSIRMIRIAFGQNVSDMVSDLTDVSKPEDGNRAKRKEIDRQHTSQSSALAKTVKLADLISNSQTIAENDPEFAKVYMNEKRLLLEVLTEGHELLYRRAKAIVDGYYRESGND